MSTAAPPPPPPPPPPLPDPDAIEARVRAGFAAQPFMALLGAELAAIAPGRVEIALAVRPALGQQQGFVHAGAAWSIADSAAGFAALTTMLADSDVLTVELKINLLRPAAGARLRAVGTVLRPGRQLTVCRADVMAESDAGSGDEAPAPRLVATALGTFVRVAATPRQSG